MSASSPEFWTQMSEGFQQNLTKSWGQAMQHFQTMDLGGLKPAADAAVPELKFSPEKLQALQGQYFKDASELWNQSLHNSLQVKDRRFSGDAWMSNPVAAFNAATYLLNARTLMGLADAVDADPKTRTRIRFAIEQWVAAAAPSNFLAFNAEAQKKAVETKGESIAKGVQNLMHDMQQGHVSMTDESLFEVGKNVATTEGAVVFENEFFQLIDEIRILDPARIGRPLHGEVLGFWYRDAAYPVALRLRAHIQQLDTRVGCNQRHRLDWCHRTGIGPACLLLALLGEAEDSGGIGHGAGLDVRKGAAIIGCGAGDSGATSDRKRLVRKCIKMVHMGIIAPKQGF